MPSLSLAKSTSFLKELQRISPKMGMLWLLLGTKRLVWVVAISLMALKLNRSVQD